MSTSIYTLNNGTAGVEENRLDWQHREVFKPVTELLIPENVRQYLESLCRPPVVADVATGTGVWLRDLATTLPSQAQLDGFDFDTSKFPKPAQLPSNIKLAFGDALKTPPAEQQGKYDLVHIRCLKYGLKADQWEIVAANMRQLLRPGGFLAWDEVGYPSWNCLPMTPTFQKFIALDVTYAQSVGRDIMSPLNLPKYMTTAGFGDCHQTVFSTFSKDRKIWDGAAEVMISGAGQAIKGIVGRGGYDWAQSTQDVDDVCAKLREDVQNQVCAIGFEIYWTVGRNA